MGQKSLMGFAAVDLPRITEIDTNAEFVGIGVIRGRSPEMMWV